MHGPLIEGTISVLPQALYRLQVDILQTDFGEFSEYVNITLNDRSYGRCSPPAKDSCDWYPCDMDESEFRAANDSVNVHIQFSRDVEATRYCQSRVEAKITLELKG